MKARVLVSAAVAALALAGSAACGLVIGLQDHQPYPAEAGPTVEGGLPDQAAGNPDTGSDASDGGAPHESGVGCDASLCGGGCVDLQTNANNCGTCGHSCNGQGCYAGVCGGNAVVQLTAGDSHDCVLLQAGEVWCWGADDQGQILGPGGDAAAPPATCPNGPCRQQPTRIPGLPPIAKVSAGGNSTCAVDMDGGVWCWGENHRAGLGHDPAGDMTCNAAAGFQTPCDPTPTQVAGLPGPASSVATGEGGFTCALVSGSVYCWGDSLYDELGPNGSSAPTPTPLVVLADAGASAISAGYQHACALVGTTAQCWGANQFGELGHTPGSGDVGCFAGAQCSPTPQPIGVPNVLDVHAGHWTTCVRTPNGPLCMGANDSAQLGTATSNSTANPTPSTLTGVSPAPAAVAIDLAYKTGCVIALTQLSCWGDDETHQTADPQGQSTCTSGLPCELTSFRVPLSNVIETRTSPYVTLARTQDGKVWAWGDNGVGQLAHAPGSQGDVPGCDMSTFDAGTTCDVKPLQVGGLP